MNVRITVDTSDVDDEFDRLLAGPDSHDILTFESVIARQFMATQMFVHVQTGELRDSGRVDSTLRGHQWEGEILYGGGHIDAAEERDRDPARGYAPRGWLEGHDDSGRQNDLHDFLRPVGDFESEYGDAMSAFLRKGAE